MYKIWNLAQYSVSQGVAMQDIWILFDLEHHQSVQLDPYSNAFDKALLDEYILRDPDEEEKPKHVSPFFLKLNKRVECTQHSRYWYI